MRESLPFFIARPSARSGTAEELEKSGEKGKNRAFPKQKNPQKKQNRKDQRREERSKALPPDGLSSGPREL